MHIRLTASTAATALLMLSQGSAPAAAQSNPGYFIPPQPAQARPAGQPRPPRTARPVPVQAAPLPPVQESDAGQQDDPGASQQQQMPPLPHPPIPNLPSLPKANTPPAVVIGILSVPDVMRQSNADQIITRIIGARKEKLRGDVDRAQASWRQQYQQLQADAPKMTPDQGHARERALRAKVEGERAQLQARYRIIAEAGQVALNQIESTLLAVVKQVAEARAMNVVLHRSQVALNMPEFDITDQVTAQLNKLLPTVQIPAENIDPASLPKDWSNAVVANALATATAAAAAAAPPPATH